MLFDLRGRRKRVIQVIYVLLALIMVLSLFVIGLPGGLNPFTSGGNLVSENTAKLSEKRAENLEKRIAAQPNKNGARGELVRARITAGNSLVEIGDNGQQIITDDATEQYELAATAWEKYLKATNGHPDPGVAQVVASTLINLASGTVAQFQSNMSTVVQAQKFVAADAVKQARKGGPSPASALTALARYQYFNQDYAAAEKTRDQALASADTAAIRKQINTQLDADKKQAKSIGKQIKAAKKQAGKNKGQSLQDPFGSLGGTNPSTATP